MSRCARWLGAVVLIVTMAHSSPVAAQRLQSTEVHGGFAGGTSSLDTGGEIGVARDWSGAWNSYGFGAAWITGTTGSPEQQLWGMIVGSTVRVYLPREKLRPYGEAGFNVYFIGYENIVDDDREGSFVNPGL